MGKMKIFWSSLSHCLFFVVLSVGNAQAQLNQEINAVFACHIRAALVNSGEPVFWSDLEPCNAALNKMTGPEESSEEYLSTLLNRAILLMELTEFDRARADLEAASLVDPSSPYLQLNLGLLNFLESRYQDAITNFSTVVEFEQLRALALLNRTLAYGYSDNFDLALQDLLQLRREYPQEFSAWISSEQSEFFPDLIALLPD
jgi:lipoprotein NlpI